MPNNWIHLTAKYRPDLKSSGFLTRLAAGNPERWAAKRMPILNSRLRDILVDAYGPCPEFGNVCQDMRWNPELGHVPRGFCGATASLEDVALILVVAEPGDPQPNERHPPTAHEALDSTIRYAYECFRSGRDQFHRNIRQILDLCWPGEDFDAHMRRTYITESVLCSAKEEGAAVPTKVGRVCRARFLDRQLELFPQAVVAALGSKAANRLKGREFVRGFAAAPPGCNFRGAQESWAAIAEEVRRRAA